MHKKLVLKVHGTKHLQMKS